MFHVSDSLNIFLVNSSSRNKLLHAMNGLYPKILFLSHTRSSFTQKVPLRHGMWFPGEINRPGKCSCFYGASKVILRLEIIIFSVRFRFSPIRKIDQECEMNEANGKVFLIKQ